MIDNDLESIKLMINDFIDRYYESPINLLNRNDVEAERKYLIAHKQEYIRTINDIVLYFKNSRIQKIKILEVGSFLGVVSVILSRIGFQVISIDIDEYISSKNLQQLFIDNGIRFSAVNLRDYRIPLSSEEFDAVIMCEVLEHLNFNPLPVIKEINRILKKGGLLYITLPNLLRSVNVLQLALYGKSIHNPIKDFFTQLSSTEGNKIVGLHWREYTSAELKEMLEEMNFLIVRQYYEEPGNPDNRSQFKLLVKQMIRSIISRKTIKESLFSILYDPYLDKERKSIQIHLAVKKDQCNKDFFFTSATLP